MRITQLLSIFESSEFLSEHESGCWVEEIFIITYDTKDGLNSEVPRASGANTYQYTLVDQN